MTYGALNTVTMADAQHAWEVISGLLNWACQSLT